MTVAPYITAPADVVCSGWVQLGDVWVSREPLRDASTGLYARLTWQGGADACAALGGRLPLDVEVDAIFAACDDGRGLVLDPVTLPDAHLCAEAGIVFNWETHEKDLRAFLTANMGGRAWAEYHDAKVTRQLNEAGFAGFDERVQLLANVGKLWIGGVLVDSAVYAPPAGRAYLYGWRQHNGHMTQGRPEKNSHGPHGVNDEHDYGTLAVCVCDEEPT